jgi:hypothetical protein
VVSEGLLDHFLGDLLLCFHFTELIKTHRDPAPQMSVERTFAPLARADVVTAEEGEEQGRIRSESKEEQRVTHTQRQGVRHMSNLAFLVFRGLFRGRALGVSGEGRSGDGGRDALTGIDASNLSCFSFSESSQRK